jgi:hypothetical protein
MAAAFGHLRYGAEGLRTALAALAFTGDGLPGLAPSRLPHSL